MDTFFSALRGIDYFLLMMIGMTFLLSFVSGFFESTAFLFSQEEGKSPKIAFEDALETYVPFVWWAMFSLLALIFWTNTNLDPVFGLQNEHHVFIFVTGTAIGFVTQIVVKYIHGWFIICGFMCPVLIRMWVIIPIRRLIRSGI